MSTNLTVKGQVTVPKSVRDYLGLKSESAVTPFAKLRGRATVRMKTAEIMALTRGARG